MILKVHEYFLSFFDKNVLTNVSMSFILYLSINDKYIMINDASDKQSLILN